MSSIKKLVFKTGRFELNIPELEIPAHGVTALTGPSGSGKTTLLKVLLGLHQPQGWEWQSEGAALHTLPLAERRMGVVFQGYDLFPHMTAEENILLVLKSRHPGKKREQMLQQLELFKEQLGLSSCWKTNAHDLSGGEKQRVALLRALVSAPRMLLLDEPFSALDSELRGEARALVKKIISQLNIPVLLVTHDRADVEELAHHEIQLVSGRVVSSSAVT